jgi:hypothetical protein
MLARFLLFQICLRLWQINCKQQGIASDGLKKRLLCVMFISRIFMMRNKKQAVTFLRRLKRGHLECYWV